MLSLVINQFPTTKVGDAPNVDVEISLAPPTQGPIWRSIVSYARQATGITVSRGRPLETDNFQTGTCAIQLDNKGRVFDPNYTGPLQPNIVPERRLRVTERYAGATAIRFDGYVDGFTQTYDPPYVAWAEIQAGDAFKVLAQYNLPTLSWWQAVVYQDKPLAWYRLGETSGTTMVDSSGNGLGGTHYLAPTTAAGAISNDTNAALTYNGTTQYSLSSADQLLSLFAASGTSLTVEFWFKTSAAAASTTPLIYFKGTSGGTVQDTLIGIGTGGVLSTSTGKSSTVVNDGTYHHAVLSRNGSTDTLYVDGVLQSGNVTASVIVGANVGLWIAGYIESTGTLCISATMDEVIVYNYALSAARALEHYNAGHASFSGVDTGAQTTRVLNYANIPGLDTAIDTGSSTIGATSLTGQTLLDYLRTLSTTEVNQFYCGVNGARTAQQTFSVVFRARHSQMTDTRSATSQYTFGDGGGSELPYADILFDYSELRIYNEAHVTRTGGVEQVSINTASQGQYWPRSYIKTGLLYNSDGDSYDHASFVVNKYSNPLLRIIGLVIEPGAAPTTLYPAILAMEIGTRITVKRRPQGVGVAISQDAIIEGIQDTEIDGLRTVTLQLSTADSTSYWILGDSTYSVLDSTTRLAF